MLSLNTICLTAFSLMLFYEDNLLFSQFLTKRDMDIIEITGIKTRCTEIIEYITDDACVGAFFARLLRCRICETVSCLTNAPLQLCKARVKSSQFPKWFCRQCIAACCLVMTLIVQDSSAQSLCTSEHHADQLVEVSACLIS